MALNLLAMTRIKYLRPLENRGIYIMIQNFSKNYSYECNSWFYDWGSPQHEDIKGSQH